MADELVHLDVAHGVATITLDSPSNRNALSSKLVGQLAAHLATAEADDGARVVVLAHTGSTFCAGADLTEASQGPQHGARVLVELMQTIANLPKPVVARLDGHVRAGGLGIIGACDIVIAGQGTTYAFSEVRLGLAPAMISLTTLPRLTDRAASRYLLTGETFVATVAERIGLVTVATDDVGAAMADVLAQLRQASPQGLRETKALTAAGVRRSLDSGAQEMTELSAGLFASEEAREGMLAFLERRPPRWATSEK